MSEKQFEYGETDLFEWVEVDGKMISTKECVNKLNEQQATIHSLKEENEQLKKRNKFLDEMIYKLQWRFQQEVGIEKAEEHFQEIHKEMNNNG